MKCVLVLLLLLHSASAVPNVVKSVYQGTRRILNFGSLFGSAVNAETPYDRICGHPVFAVTTPYGSPYMTVEKMNKADYVSDPDVEKKSGNRNEQTRTIIAYYMDPDDAMSVQTDLKQVPSMKTADIRITSMSLGKALRQASHVGGGLPTGAEVSVEGKLDPNEGAALRYKIVPPRRELFYAARCKGKERVGFFDDAQDIARSALSVSGISLSNLKRRRAMEDRQFAPKFTKEQAESAHMEGKTGIPVFYCPHIRRRVSPIHRIVAGQKRESIPMFFSYEDLEKSWGKLKDTSGGPKDVEVFNLWDLLTSMDIDSSKSKPSSVASRMLQPLSKRFGESAPPGFQDIYFVPSARGVVFKEEISARGNGKARLRPMR